MFNSKYITTFAAAALLVSGPALATNVNLSGDSGEKTLQQVFDDATVGGSSSIDVNSDQAPSSAYWSVAASGGSFTQMVVEIAGNANQNAFGIFDAANPSKQVQLFSGPQSPNESGANVSFGFTTDHEVYKGDVYDGGTGITFGDNLFGYYLDTPDGTLYSASGLNPDDAQHMLAFQGGDGDQVQVGGTAAGPFLTDDYFLAWEDIAGDGSDRDFNDFVAIAESIQPQNVPAPSALGVALFGLGLVGFGVFARRRATGFSADAA